MMPIGRLSVLSPRPGNWKAGRCVSEQAPKPNRHDSMHQPPRRCQRPRRGDRSTHHPLQKIVPNPCPCDHCFTITMAAMKKARPVVLVVVEKPPTRRKPWRCSSAKPPMCAGCSAFWSGFSGRSTYRSISIVFFLLHSLYRFNA